MLAPASGTTLTISDAIADQSGNGGAGSSAGSGGLVIDGAGTVDLGAANSFAGGVTIDSGTLVLGNAAGAGSGTITFGTGDPPDLQFTIANKPTNTIAGFATDDTIDVTDMTGTAATATLGSGGALAIPYNTGTLDLTFTGVSPGQAFDLTTDGNSGTDITIACYCRGTLILTERGGISVEDLRIGDRLVTAAGMLRPLRWVGRRSYGGAFIAGNRRVLPVRIAAGALVDGVPKRDLFVSPEHALFLDGMLVPAIALVNGSSVVQVAGVETVEYVHLELDSHDVLVAEGALAERICGSLDHERGLRDADGCSRLGVALSPQAAPHRGLPGLVEADHLRRRRVPSSASDAVRATFDAANHQRVAGRPGGCFFSTASSLVAIATASEIEQIS